MIAAVTAIVLLVLLFVLKLQYDPTSVRKSAFPASVDANDDSDAAIYRSSTNVAAAAAAAATTTTTTTITSKVLIPEQKGLTLTVYSNTALVGRPACTRLVQKPILSIPNDCFDEGTGNRNEENVHGYQRYSFGGNVASIPTPEAAVPCSAALSGTVHFASAGLYSFHCSFRSTSTAWVWIDGHLVCSDGHAYGSHLADPASYDNPLTIRQSSNNMSLPFRAHLTNNQNCIHHRRPRHGRSFGSQDDDHHHHQQQQVSDSEIRLEVTWEKIRRPVNTTSSLTIRPRHILQRDNRKKEEQEDKGAGISFSPGLPEAEQQRDNLQKSFLSSAGWGTWLHHDMLSIVKLPEGCTIAVQLCRKSSKTCWSKGTADGYGVSTRVGLHAVDGSYAQTFAGPAKKNGIYANVSIEYSSSRSAPSSRQHLDMLITAVSCNDVDADKNIAASDCSDYEVRIGGRYAWFRAGTVAAAVDHLPGDPLALNFNSPGFSEPTQISSSQAERAFSNPNSTLGTLIIPLTKVGKSVEISTRNNATVEEIRAILDHGRAAEEQRLLHRFGKNANTATAIQAAIMWTAIYTPVENNAVVIPVSRVWGNNMNSALTTDWTYILFDWDNFFASLLAGFVVDKSIAYSNIFQVVKSKTAAGFIPNYAAGGKKSQDRTEPSVGAKVVLELYRKFGDKWMIEVVFHDLLDWHNWVLRKRILYPAGLVATGSWNEQADVMGIPQQGHKPNTMQGARWESGMDNSPMYDGDDFFDNSTTHLMQLYDVGMSALFVQDSYALAELARIIGCDQKLSDKLWLDGKMMADRIQKHLWDPEGRIYTNRFLNGTFYRHVSPTSFYSMAAGAASDKQAEMMADAWLMNASRFCISPTGDFRGNSEDGCYWGLPSISADDVAFPRLGYWRGYIWGPMATLVYWSLQNYDHVRSVREARKGLCKQMKALFLHHWNANAHVCENYNPHKSAADCSGTNFYHWGALLGLIGMLEDDSDDDLDVGATSEQE